MVEPFSSRIASRGRRLQSSVEDFRWRLDTIENELRHLPQNLCVLLSSTPLTGEGACNSLFACRDKQRLGTQTAGWFSEGNLPFYPSIGQSTDSFPFGVVLARTPALIELVMDGERTCLRFGGKCGFYESIAGARHSIPGDNRTEWTEGIIWHYFDEISGVPIPAESLFDRIYEDLLRCYRGILEVCRDFEDQLSIGGDELTPIIYELEWPEVLLYLGWKNSHPLLSVERESVVRAFQGEELVPWGKPGECHDVFRIRPASVARATMYALEALSRMVNTVDESAVGGEDKTQPDHGGCSDPPDDDFLTEDHPDAEKYREQGKWCIGKYALEQYDLKRNQLTRAHQKGLFGVKIDPPKKVKHEKGRTLEVFLRADLMSLADAKNRQAENREQSE